MVNIDGLNKADVLAEIYNYAVDMKSALRRTDMSIEDAASQLEIAKAEDTWRRTQKTKHNLPTKTEKIVQDISGNLGSSGYWDRARAQKQLNEDKTINKISGVYIDTSFKGRDLDTINYNSTYGQYAFENLVNGLKDEISFKKDGTKKKANKKYD